MLRAIVASALLSAVAVATLPVKDEVKVVKGGGKDGSSSSGSSSSSTAASEEEVVPITTTAKNGDSITSGVNAFMYNIEDDPTESTNLYDKPAYGAGQTYFYEKMTDYSKLVVAPQIPDSTDMYAKWKSSGGLVPWVETNLKSGPVGKKYTYSDAPHIVFLLVDDWGWNDVGYHSTDMSWTTPNIDELAANGIKLENHYSHELCSPSRGALLTGRYALRLGLHEQQESDPFAELPLTETTLAQELKSAGYATYMVGKWDLGFSTTMHNPTNRGFDKFYGYYSSFVDYFTKEHNGYLDLQSDEDLVTDEAATDKTKHNVYLMQEKVEEYIDFHATTYPYKPMFLYYSTQLIHGPWVAPSTYTDRCGVPWKIADPRIQADTQNYCALNLMLDEIVANTTCKLKAKQMAEETVFVIVSDNGGEKTIAGNSYPYKGHKGSYQNGGVKTTAIIHTSLVETSKRGSTFTGAVHITDWLPTLMHIATNGAWEGSLSGADIDGVDLWSAISTTKNTVEHEEIPFYVNADASSAVIQRGNYKYFYNREDNTVDEPSYVFEYDLHPDHAYKSCASIIMTGEDVHPKEVDQELEEYRQTVRGETGQGFLDVAAADAPKAGTSVFSPPAETTAPEAEAAAAAEATTTTETGESETKTTKSATTTSSQGTLASQGAKATSANQATATAPITQHTATLSFYRTNGYSSLDMTLIMASITALLLFAHVGLRRWRYLEVDEVAVKADRVGVADFAARGRYSSLNDIEV